jgi:hypothetical protein
MKFRNLSGLRIEMIDDFRKDAKGAWFHIVSRLSTVTTVGGRHLRFAKVAAQTFAKSGVVAILRNTPMISCRW